jgi:hypothetical protein
MGGVQGMWRAAMARSGLVTLELDVGGQRVRMAPPSMWILVWLMELEASLAKVRTRRQPPWTARSPPLILLRMRPGRGQSPCQETRNRSQNSATAAASPLGNLGSPTDPTQNNGPMSQNASPKIVSDGPDHGVDAYAATKYTSLEQLDQLAVVPNEEDDRCLISLSEGAS